MILDLLECEEDATIDYHHRFVEHILTYMQKNIWYLKKEHQNL